MITRCIVSLHVDFVCKQLLPSSYNYKGGKTYGCGGNRAHGCSSWYVLALVAAAVTLSASSSSSSTCTSAKDCSLNGLCISDRCKCDAAWTGAHCDILAFTSAHHRSGYRRVQSGANTSGAIARAIAGTIWGASVMLSEVDPAIAHAIVHAIVHMIFGLV